METSSNDGSHELGQHGRSLSLALSALCTWFLGLFSCANHDLGGRTLHSTGLGIYPRWIDVVGVMPHDLRFPHHVTVGRASRMHPDGRTG